MIDVFALIAKFQYALQNAWGYIWGTAGITWTEAKQKALVNSFVKEFGSNWKNDPVAKERDKYRGAVYGSKWIGHVVADCSGLFKWAFGQLGGSIAHGSNSIYKSYCSSKGAFKNGKRTDGKELKPGTAVFTGDSSDRGHIGLYIGDGKVIEAQGTTAGVVISKITLTKWTWWGELKNVDYSKVGGSTPATTEPAKETEKPATDEGFPTLRKGDKGSYVTMLQTTLLQRGYDLGKYGADGDFGNLTEAAVKQFQQDWGLLSDGIVGPQTWDKIQNTPLNKIVMVHIPNLTQLQAEGLIKKYPGSYMTE